jgi:hypothetical protein
MRDTGQLCEILFGPSVAGALKSSPFRDNYGYDEVVLSTRAALADHLNQTRSVSGFVGYLPDWEPVTSIQWLSAANTVAYDEEERTNWIQPNWKCSTYEGQFNLVPIRAISLECLPQAECSDFQQSVEWVVPPSCELIAVEVMQFKPRTDFFCEVAAAGSELFATYLAKEARETSELLKRFYRRYVSLTVAACKSGYLALRIETAARDHVIHLEMITLAAEHEEAPGSSAVGQIPTLGEETWTRIKRSFLGFFSSCSVKMLRIGSIGAGVNTAARLFC